MTECKIWIENNRLYITHPFDNFLNEKYRQFYFTWNNVAKQREKDLKKVDLRSIAFIKSMIINSKKYKFNVDPKVLEFIKEKMGGEAEVAGPGFGEIEKAKPVDTNIDFSFMKVNPFEYQKHGIAFINSVNGVAMLGDEMGVGKCILDSRVYGNFGYKKIEDIFNEYKKQSSLNLDKDGGEWYSLNKKLKVFSLNKSGKVVSSKVNKIYREKIDNELKTVSLEDGSSIRCTKAHKLITLSGWTNQFQVNDYVMIPRKIQFKGNKIDKDLVIFLAWLISEGNESKKRATFFITQKDKNILTNIYKSIFRYSSKNKIKLNKPKIRKDCRSGLYCLIINSKELKEHLVNKYSYNYGQLSRTKKIPDCILTADEDSVKTFISHYFEAEASVSKSVIEIATASKTIIEQLSILLRRFGIWLRYTSKQKMATNGLRIKREYWIGLIGGSSAREFYKSIRFIKKEKNKRLNKINSVKLNDNVDIIPSLDICREIHKFRIPQHHTGIHSVYTNNQNLSRTTTKLVIDKLDKILSGEALREYSKLSKSKWTNDVLKIYKNLNYDYLRALRNLLAERLSYEVFYTKIKKISLEKYSGYVYDLSVEENHNYIANGIFTHNTLQVISYSTLNNLYTVIVCPASLKYKWKAEVEKFTGRSAVVLSEYSPDKLDPKSKKLADFVIINYEQLVKYEKYLSKIKFDLVTLDESHYIINLQAQRTKIVFKLFKKIPKRICVSGTPIKNRPIDFYPQLKFLRPDIFSNKMDYGLRYCNAKETPYGWDLKGSSNLDELYKRMSSFYIRRIKKEVLKDLPEKTVSLIEIEMNDSEGQEYQELKDDFYEVLKNKKDGLDMADLGKMIKMRQFCSKSKIDRVVEFVEEFLESSDDRKIVIFSQFIETQKKLKEAFKGRCVSLLGEDSAIKRNESVQSFQNDPKVRVFVGSTIAAGVGIDLYAADTAVFVDLLWSPSDHQQAEDRLLRIGQKNAVSIYYFTFKNSIESMLWSVVGKKLSIINEVLEGKKDVQNSFNAERLVFNQFLTEFRKDLPQK